MTNNLTLEDFIERIHKGTYKTIEIERLAHKTGNTDGSGNYTILKLKLGGNEDAEQIEFNNSKGTWTKT